ncbi:MAG: transposase [Candidatus Omnitrophica bacterium]|nr:transposase [Candidatus Omnitrophota bacterium]
MARLPRVVIENTPHHITQRGHRGHKVFLKKSDKAEYLCILADIAHKYGVAFWAYCLMDNHVHFVAVPAQPQSLAKCFQETNKTYTRKVNLREGWRGGMWESRFKSFVLDESHLYAAVRYVERNPVRAGIVSRAEAYPYSSAKAHVFKTNDPLIKDSFLTKEIIDWAEYLRDPDDPVDTMRRHLSTGRPLGGPEFIQRIERRLNRVLKKKKTGPKERLNQN